MFGGDPLVLGNNDFPGLIDEVEVRYLTAQTLRHQRKLYMLLDQVEQVEVEELGQNLFRRHTQRLEQGRDRHLAPTVDAEKERVLRVEFKIQP